MSGNNKTAIISWWPAHNIGDDLLAITFINNTNFDRYIFTSFRTKTKTVRKSIKSIQNNIKFSKKVFFKSDDSVSELLNDENAYLIKIGGSVWSEHTLSQKYEFLRRIGKNKVVYFGNNLSLSRERGKYIEKINELFDASLFTSVRDSFSIKGTNLKRFYYDPVYSINNSTIKSCKKTKSGVVSISVAYPDSVFNYNFDKNILYLKIHSILETIPNIKEINLLSFHNKKDIPICEELYSILNEKSIYKNLKISIIKYNNIKTTIGFIKKAEYMINTRFHSIVLSNLMRKKSFNISYDTKNEFHLKDISAPNNCQEIFLISENKLRLIKEDSQKQFEDFKRIINYRNMD